MKLRVPLSALLGLLLLVNHACAESRAKGSGSVNGKTVSYEFVGNESVSASGMTNNDTTTINGTVDGATHVIKVIPGKLSWNDKDFQLGNYKQIEIFITPEKQSIKVDGKEILPKQK